MLAVSPAAAAGRGERALKASFYLNTIPTLVEIVNDVKKDVFDELKLDPRERKVVETALSEVWTEKHIYANASVALEKQLPRAVLDAALAEMNAEVQAAIKAGIVEKAPDPEKAMVVVRKHPDAKTREELARRIVAHMPEPKSFKELLGEVVEVLADVGQVISGNDEMRADFRKSLMTGLDPLVKAVGNREPMIQGALIAYREQPTSRIQALANALDSDAGRKLQQAAVSSLLEGCRQSRRDLVARLTRELKKKKK
jgi:hypothetical protein